MTVPRMVIGKSDSGTGRRVVVSLPGVNVVSADHNDSSRIALNSDWSDIARLHQISIVDLSGIASRVVNFPSLGYIPFCDVRRKDGNIYYDDENSYTSVAGGGYFYPGWKTSLSLTANDGSATVMNNIANTSYRSPCQALFIAWRLRAR